MANRRMFSLDVVDTDHFLDLPVSAQALYFHLGMRADDDGFVNSPKKILQLIGSNPDDLKVLIAKGYVIPFESGIIVITHWRTNNYVRCDRYTKTSHENELLTLELKNGKYTICQPDVIPTVYTDKNRIDKNRVKEGSPEPENQPPDPSGLLLPLVDKTEYNVPLSKIATWEAAYPAVDVRQELKKMLSWLDSNPTRRKTRKGIERFINTWLSKEQDRGRYKKPEEEEFVSAVRRSPEQRAKEAEEWYQAWQERERLNPTIYDDEHPFGR